MDMLMPQTKNTLFGNLGTIEAALWLGQTTRMPAVGGVVTMEAHHSICWLRLKWADRRMQQVQMQCAG